MAPANIPHTRIQVEDTHPSETFTGQLTDVSAVQKFELSVQEYAQRQGASLSRRIHLVTKKKKKNRAAF